LTCSRIGSTEHVEARIDDLRRNGWGYINVDVAAYGPNLIANASPMFSKAFTRVLKRTSDPKSGQIMNDIWREKGSKLGNLGAGSDHVAFQNFAGVSSFDISFEGDTFPYHSCIENFEWAATQGDPGFQYHKLAGQMISLLALELADEPILPFDLEAYSQSVGGYVKSLETYVANITQTIPSAKDKKLDFANLQNATAFFNEKAKEFHEWDKAWSRSYDTTGVPEGDLAALQRMSYNDRLAGFESSLLDVDGGVSCRVVTIRFMLTEDSSQRDPNINTSFSPLTNGQAMMERLFQVHVML
jgi:hypothetical protein